MDANEVAKRAAALRKEIEDRERLLAAYELVSRDLELAESTEVEAPGLSEAATNGSVAYGSKSEAIREAIKSQKGEFSMDQLEPWLKSHGHAISRQDISFALYRLTKNEEITLKTKGGAKRPSTYIKRQ